MLLEAAFREEDRQQLAALEAGAFPWMEDKARAEVVRRLRSSLVPREDQQAQIDANWQTLRRARGLH